jgi:hypothetical protein
MSQTNNRDIVLSLISEWKILLTSPTLEIHPVEHEKRHGLPNPTVIEWNDAKLPLDGRHHKYGRLVLLIE